MKIQFSPELAQELKEIKQKNPKLVAKIEKQVALFAEDPKYSSLNNRWSILITMNIRMVYMLMEDQESGETYAYFIAVGTHDQVYGK